MLDRKDKLIILKELTFYLVFLLAVIFSYFILIRQTLYFPYITEALSSLGSSFIIILLYFPIAVFFIPFIFKFFGTRTPPVKKNTLIKIAFTLLITFILAISVDEIEALVSNRDTVVTTSNWMEPTIPVFAKDRDRGTNFMWLKVSMVLFQISYASLEFTDIRQKITE